jgi:ATP-dependent Clp protease, protease subunit
MDFRVEWDGTVLVLWFYGAVYQSTYSQWGLHNLLAQANTQGMTELVVYINSPGGSVIAGADLFETIKGVSVPTTAIVRGMAGSMAAFLLFAFDTVKMSAKARIMFHEVATYVGDYQSAAQLRSLADMTESFTSDYAEEAANHMSITTAQFLENIKGKDWWLTPQAAVAVGLVDEIINDPAASDKEPTGDSLDLQATYTQYYAPLKAVALFYNHSNEEISMKALALKLGLSADATEAEIETAVGKLQQTIDAAKKAEETAVEARATDLVTRYVQSGQLTAAQAPLMKSNAKTDYEGTKAFLEAMPKTPGQGQRIGDQLKPETPNVTATGEEPKTWAELTAMGTQAVVQYEMDSPDKFKALLEGKFGDQNLKKINN